MPRILLRSYSTYFDPKTRTQFSPVLDRQSGCKVAVADVSDEVAEQLQSRPGFELLTDEEFLVMTAPPVDPEPIASETGNPLTDKQKPAAKAGKAAAADAGPPPPPPGG